MARILITTFGSFGDLHPYLAVGTELRRRGHAVTIATGAAYQPKIEEEGLGFHAVRPDIELENRELIEYAMDARRGSERIVRYLSERIRESCEDTADASRNADVIITHPITFASVMVAQKRDLPWASTVLAPIMFLSAYDPPVSSQAPWLIKLKPLGPGFTKAIWDLGRRHARAWVKPVMEFRREQGLPGDENPLFEGANSPSLVLALFSRVLAAPQPDWPQQTIVTGFPFHDRGELAHELESFLARGPAPVVFTLGSSAVAAAGTFYLESLEAVRRLGCRAVFLTGAHPQGLPDALPPGVMAVPYAPHGSIFPAAAVIVHQGGIGTTAQAMRSGRPMLIVPFGHDQFDNAARVQRLGAAEVLYRSRYNGPRVADVLRRLIEERSFAKAAGRVGERIRAENGAASAADVLETWLATAGVRKSAR